MGLPQTALVSGGMSVASNIMQGMTNAQNEDAQKQENLYNAKQERFAVTQSFQEGAMTANQIADRATKDIALGYNKMSAGGNVGSSAQSAVIQSGFNLDKDLSAINYKYSNEAIQHENKAKAFDYSAKIAKKNRLSAMVGSYIGAASSAVSAKANYDYFKGEV